MSSESHQAVKDAPLETERLEPTALEAGAWERAVELGRGEVLPRRERVGRAGLVGHLRLAGEPPLK